MELRHLRYFVAVAEEGHVTRAAERLGIQQPPLSQQIRALETELDVQLFWRKPRGVELTAAGEALLGDARAILDHVAHARAATQRSARGERGRVVVGFTSSAPFHPFVPRVIRAFREAYADVSLALEEGGTSELVDGLTDERLDVAFIRSPAPEGAGLAVHALLKEEMLAAFPSGHKLAPDPPESDARPLALADIAAEPFILYRRHVGHGLYDAIIAACHRAGFSPEIGQEAPRILSTLNLVAAGLGVSLVPASLGRLGMPGVAYRRLKGRPALTAPLNLACRRAEPAPATQNFIRLVRRMAKQRDVSEERV